MIRSIAVSSLIMIACLLLQSTVMQSIVLFGVIPDISLIVLVYVSVRNGSFEGQVSGFVTGLAADAISAAPLGFNALIRTLSGFAFGLLYGNFFIDSIFFPAILCFSAVLLKGLSTLFLHFSFSAIPSYNFLRSEIWLHAAYTALVAPLGFFILDHLKSLLITEQNRV